MKTNAMLVALVLAAFGLMLPLASAGPGYCDYKEESTSPGHGTFSNDCQGVDGSGCVGKWGEAGNWEDHADGRGRTYHYTSWYRSVLCPAGNVIVNVHGLGADVVG